MKTRPPRDPRLAWRVWVALLQLALFSAGTSGVSQNTVLARDAAAIVKGPVEARVLRIIDGDTIVVRARIWPGQHIKVSVRLAGLTRRNCAAAARQRETLRGAPAITCAG